MQQFVAVNLPFSFLTATVLGSDPPPDDDDDNWPRKIMPKAPSPIASNNLILKLN